jgi:hypothetical protein
VLDGDHARLVEVAMPVCAEYGLGLAGGYAVSAHGLADRPSDDVDFATGESTPMREIIDALAAVYRGAGFGVEILDVDARKGHLLVALSAQAKYRVDVLKEPLQSPLTMMHFGLVVALEDSVAMKMSALYERCLPRDLIDVHGAAQRFSHAELISLVRRLREGDLSLEVFRDQLEFAATYPDEAFTRYGADTAQTFELRRWAQEWAIELGGQLADAEPPDEL